MGVRGHCWAFLGGTYPWDKEIALIGVFGRIIDFSTALRHPYRA